MEVFDDRCSLALGGTKQRATLGYLLLQANRVVATSQLLNALWSVDDAPISARKILQNAVWGLRRVLTRGESTDTALVTQAPGYKLSVDANDIDLFRFQRQVDAGRDELAAGEPEQAARILKGALSLWRGPVLADLVEAGINWPELSAAQNAQWDAMEDYFEAELACGRHLAVLGELEAMVESMALRERSSGQLMLALYRSGRQADALSVYSRVRTALVEELGLEPGRDLQLLQQAILAHDPSLIPPRVPGHGETVVVRDSAPRAPEAPPTDRTPAVVGTHLATASTSRTRASAEAHPAARPERPAGVRGSGLRSGQAGAAPVYDSGDLAHAIAEQHEATARSHEPLPHREFAGAPRSVTGNGRRKSVSALLVRTQLGPEAADIDPLRIDETLEDVAHRIRENIEHFGGTVSASIGSVSMALFGAHGECEEAAERAVLAAVTIREELRAGSGAVVRTPSLAKGLSFHAAIVTGEALVRYQPDGDSPLSITGTLFDRGHALLSHAGAGEIRSCDVTRRATEPSVAYGRSDDLGEWTVQGVSKESMGQDSMPTVEREFELELLRGLVERTRHRSTTHLVTVLGDAGTGKTRFLTEFERQNSDRSYLARFRELSGGVQVSSTAVTDLSPVHAVQRELVSAICSIQPGDSTRAAMEKLVGTLRRLVDDEARVGRLLECLAPYIDPEAGELALYDPELELIAWQQFLDRNTLDKPLVLVIDDLHQADDSLLDFVSGFADMSRVPVFVVASARPELLERRPEWGGGKRHVTTITLEALSDAAVDELIDFMLSPAPSEQKGLTHWFRKRLYATAGDRPDERRTYVRNLLSMSAPGRFFAANHSPRCVTSAAPLVSSGTGRI
ncbi:BTAD domain-containing putative transcriptional regulator [Streptomyces sp. NPDC001851]|uniref:BTAD domain-containing putative transcriptional regulator n=1 Tax=Streptomyces sp. NPDC001851 TaxID=3154529 RepID=UPI00332BEC52